MADIFLSYSRQDKAFAAELATSLRAEGWSVWWDREIIGGQTFDAILEQELDQARCIVVLWSQKSVESEWVRGEAAVGAERERLVPLLIEDVKLPLQFRQRHAIDFSHWRGDTSADEFNGLSRAISSLVGDASPAESETQSARTRSGVFNGKTASLAAIAALVFVVGVSLLLSRVDKLDGNEKSSTPSGNGAQSDLLSPADPVSEGAKQSGRLSSTDPVTEDRTHDSYRSGGVPQANSADFPTLLAAGETKHVMLTEGEESFFRLSGAVREIVVVVDALLEKFQHGNIQASLSVLDQDGVVIQDDLVRFNEIDSGYRKVGFWQSDLEQTLGFKVTNYRNEGTFWITAMRPDNARLVPFFGGLTPASLTLDQSAKGMLGENRMAFHSISLPKGDYRSIIEFSNAEGKNTNIQGYLAILDGWGGNQTRAARFNEIDVSYRKAYRFSLPEDRLIVFKVSNTRNVIDYTLKIRKD